MKINIDNSTRRLGGVYKIVNTIDGKIYVGSCLWFAKRYSQHKSDLIKNKHCNQKLQNAVNKHGIENFRFELLETCQTENVTEREQFWLDVLKPYSAQGYNVRRQAQNNFGVKCGEEKRKKLSEFNKKHPSRGFFGKKHSPESNLSNSLAHRGKIISPESIKKIIETKRKRGYWHSEATKKKFKEIFKGRALPLTDEVIKKRAITLKQTWAKKKEVVLQTCNQCGKEFTKFAMFKNKVLCSECRHKLFGRRMTDEHKQKLYPQRVGKKHSEEHKRKISEGLNKFYSTKSNFHG